MVIYVWHEVACGNEIAHSYASTYTVLFIRYTPNGVLKKLIQQVDTSVSEKKPFGRVKMVETLGNKLNESLSNKKWALWKIQVSPMWDQTWQLQAKECNLLSILPARTLQTHLPGETHMTWDDRSQEHLNSFEKENETNALAKRQKLHHLEQPPLFKIKLDRTWKSSLGTQIWEDILIKGSNPVTLINRRNEWGSYAIPRVVVEDSRPPDVQCSPEGYPNQDTKMKQNSLEDP